MAQRPVDFAALAEELAWTANAYLDGAMRICNGLLEDEHDQSSHHFRVPLHLAFLSLELYLKAGIALGRALFPATHDLDKLQRLYDKARVGIELPRPSYFSRFTPRSLELFPDHKAPTMGQYFERLRYSSGKDGSLFPDLELADLSELKEELEKLHRNGLKLLLKTIEPRSARKRRKTPNKSLERTRAR
jgi:hypothetical protein